jgi:hypothetical protein
MHEVRWWDISLAFSFLHPWSLPVWHHYALLMSSHLGIIALARYSRPQSKLGIRSPLPSHLQHVGSELPRQSVS